MAQSARPDFWDRVAEKRRDERFMLKTHTVGVLIGVVILGAAAIAGAWGTAALFGWL